VVAAAPNGHTLLLTPDATVSLQPHLYRDLPYKPLIQLAPVALVSATDFAVVVASRHPARDMQALAQGLRDDPGTATCGSPGPGSVSHLSMIEIARAIRADVSFVHYRGVVQQLDGLLEGTLKVGVAVPSAVEPHIKAGTLRALATTGAVRSVRLPSTPTLRECGIDVVTNEWAGCSRPVRRPRRPFGCSRTRRPPPSRRSSPATISAATAWTRARSWATHSLRWSSPTFNATPRS
jgi:tripartite-type tricarboxylate transporter receptor subunit TctC